MSIDGLPIHALFVRPLGDDGKPVLGKHGGWRFEGFVEDDVEALTRTVVAAIMAHGGDNVNVTTMGAHP